MPLLETIVDGLVTIIDDSLVVGALITEVGCPEDITLLTDP